jgi:hypothetical protein
MPLPLLLLPPHCRRGGVGEYFTSQSNKNEFVKGQEISEAFFLASDLKKSKHFFLGFLPWNLKWVKSKKYRHTTKV